MVRTVQSLKAWREEVGRALFALDFRPHDDTPFRAETTALLTCDGTHVLRWRHTPGFTFRDESLVRDGLSSVALVFPERQGMEYAHRCGSGRLGAGDATLLAMSEPGSVGSPTNSHYVAVICPDSYGIVA